MWGMGPLGFGGRSLVTSGRVCALDVKRVGERISVGEARQRPLDHDVLRTRVDRLERHLGMLVGRRVVGY